MKRVWQFALIAVLACLGCVYHPYPQPVVVVSTYDASFDAAWGAAADVGVEIRVVDRTLGKILGDKAGAEVTVTVQRQADGTVEVRFSAPNSTETNPKLGDRWLSAYNYRMGR